ncbi:hypothetical protein [Streptomyces sp. NRRL S-337]|nr:hypothetical protein [Streptomyces sp. NRRL S-337]
MSWKVCAHSMVRTQSLSATFAQAQAEGFVHARDLDTGAEFGYRAD